MATGGVFAAMILGHWYLVTPKLPEAPLILIARSLLAVVALQVVLFAVWVATGAGPGGGAPFAVLVGQWALFVWLRLIVGPRLPADRVVGGRPDGTQPLDGIGDGAAVHQRRHDRRGHDPRRRPVLRGRPLVPHERPRPTPFAIQRELAGAREVPLDLAAGATVEDAWTALVAAPRCSRRPAIRPVRPQRRLCGAGDPLDEGDELAIIPPVSGGAGRRRRLG